MMLAPIYMFILWHFASELLFVVGRSQNVEMLNSCLLKVMPDVNVGQIALLTSLRFS